MSEESEESEEREEGSNKQPAKGEV